jgi:Na+-translocating ferredoxin:NAD+ oxidoreductase RnfD subunit
MIIRIWGAWTFGSFFAVLIMNMTTPFLDKLRPRVYGR